MNIRRTKILDTSPIFFPGMINMAESSSCHDESREIPTINGLQNLVEYYQNLFDKEESNNYGPDSYQYAKRKFVKYLLKTRTVV